MKRMLWVTLCCLILASAQGASFDCGKAKSKVEKLICGDPELSALDEEMAVLYREILQNSSNDPALINAQREWLNYRQQCLTTYRVKQERLNCLAYSYQHHNNILRGSLPSEFDAGKDTQQLCAHIAALVETKNALELEPEAVLNKDSPRGNDFKNLDIDGDGVADSLKTDCGTGECNLEVQLSSGGEFDLSDAPFYLIRYQQRIFALVSYSEDPESPDEAIRHGYHLRRLYLITPTGAKMVCGN